MKSLLTYTRGPERNRDRTKFLANIRMYNNELSCASSTINLPSNRNYNFGMLTLHGQLAHKVGSLFPPDQKPPRFAQSYILDPSLYDEQEPSISKLLPRIVNRLRRELSSSNNLLQTFVDVGKQLRDLNDQNQPLDEYVTIF